jgi:DNA-binding response OmpR family regulator
MNGFNIDILLIEDDNRLAELTATYLEQNGLRVAVEERGDRALERFAREKPRLVLLDLLLPGKDGLSICRELRRVHDVPILILTARDTDLDHVIGLEAGADDYVMKPVDPMVLLARVRALLRRAERGGTASAVDRRPDLTLGALRISETSREVWLHGHAVPLTTQEFELLSLLAHRAGELVSRDEFSAPCAASTTTASTAPSTAGSPSCAASSATTPRRPRASRRCGARDTC